MNSSEFKAHVRMQENHNSWLSLLLIGYIFFWKNGAYYYVKSEQIIVTGLLAFRDTFLKGTEWLMLAAYSNQKIHIKQKRIISKSMSGLLSLLKSPLRNHCHAF